ncbi:protein kinase [Candidatus Woesearchaeota archaeon]|nr:protein kinase [Candidatus Woesearchaeota archaeon]
MSFFKRNIKLKEKTKQEGSLEQILAETLELNIDEFNRERKKGRYVSDLKLEDLKLLIDDLETFEKNSNYRNIEERLDELRDSANSAVKEDKRFIGKISNKGIEIKTFYDLDKLVKVQINKEKVSIEKPELVEKRLNRIAKEIKNKGYKVIRDIDEISVRIGSNEKTFDEAIDDLKKAFAYPDFVLDNKMSPQLFEYLISERNYEDLELIATGGTRYIFRGKISDNYTEIIKVDIPQDKLKNGAAISHVKRGYNSAKELENILRISNASENNLARFLGYVDLKSKFNEEGIVTIEEEIKGKTLEYVVESQKNNDIKKYSLNDWNKVFMDVAIGVRHLHRNGLNHRDLNRGNIIINDEYNVETVNELKNTKTIYQDNGKSNIKATIIDLGNAATQEDMDRKYFERALLERGSIDEAANYLNMNVDEIKILAHTYGIDLSKLNEKSKCNNSNNEESYVSRCTGGGHFIARPEDIPIFNKNKSFVKRRNELQEPVQNANQDIYAIGVNLYYALTGKRIIEIEDRPMEGNPYAVNYETRESLLDENGDFDYKAYENLLDKSLENMTSDGEDYKLDKYKQIIKKCLTSEWKFREDGNDELIGYDNIFAKKPYGSIDELISDLKGARFDKTQDDALETLEQMKDKMSKEQYQILRKGILNN